MDIIKENKLTLAEAARELGLHISTLHRWRLKGVRGRKFPTVLVGGRRYVLRRDLQDFVNGDQLEPQRGNEIEQRVRDANRKLDARGIAPKE